jgi:hypothetical protein
VLAWRATPSLGIGDLRAPAAALAAWAAVAVVGPTIADSEHTPLNGDDLSLLWLVLTAAAISLLSLGILRRRELDQSAPEPAAPERTLGPEPALGERSS